MELTKANELLRSAHEIAKRDGVNTNWKAFETNLRNELLKQAGVPDSTDEQTILRATCTAKTYRTFPSFQERVIAEKAELDFKILKLGEFFCNPVFLELDETEQGMLRAQHRAMLTYSLILRDRIEAFGEV